MADSERGGWRDSARVAWPLLASQAAGALMLFVDRMMLAHCDDVAIQAALPAGLVSYLIVCFFQSVVAYSGTFVAQFWGARARVAMVKAFAQGIWLALLSAPLMLAAMWPAHWAMAACGHGAAVLEAEFTYFDILMAGALPQVAAAAVHGFFSGQGKTRIVMAAAVCGNLLNVALDWAMIFGHCGFPRMGLAGAAWATVAAQVAALLVPAAMLLREPLLNSARKWRAVFRFDPAMIRRIVRYGAPNGVHTLLEMLTFTGFVMLTGRLTPLEFALSNICFTINHLVFAPLYGFGMAANILSGQYQGARDQAATVRSCRTVMMMAVGYMALIGAAILLFHRQLLGMFYGEHTAFAWETFAGGGFVLLAIAMVWGFADAVGMAIAGTLKGAGDTRFVMAVAIGNDFFFWTPMFLAVMALKPTAWAMWLTVPVMLAVNTALFLHRFFKGKWREMSLVEDSERGD